MPLAYRRGEPRDEAVGQTGRRTSGRRKTGHLTWAFAGLVVLLGLLPALLAADPHWAYQPIRRPELPSVANEAWVRRPVDRFVLAALEAAGVVPSPEAEPTTLLRRVTLDLIGLPPTPAEVRAFLRDHRPDAYERVVDRLLESPHYGERWARPWLDLCHFAESDGYLTDQLRPTAWRYRDWLIRALNQDMPFDQFTVEQLAGDLLPDATIDQRIATGFMRQTLSNREGGADLEEFRALQTVDRTSLLGTVFLGLTVECAQCHDHKYEEISQREFFELYAFFDNADEVNIDAPLPGELQPLLTALPTYVARRAELLAPVQAEIDELQKRWEQKLLAAYRRPGRDHVWDRQWELLGLVWGGGEGEGQLEGTQIVKLDWSRRAPIQQSRLLDYFLKSGEVIDPSAFARLQLGELSSQLENLRKTLPPVTRAPAMRQTQTPRTTHVHEGGDFRARGIAVRPNTPAVLPPLPEGGPPDRLALARWLVAETHPLSARVEANRAWQEMFGRGLVATSADFGTQGERPTHPRLLDWLAAKFRDGGWSRKQLHREIVTSAVYRQSSRSRRDIDDPDNRLLARQRGLRFSAEQVRDAALAASGLLSRRVGGPSVFPPQPESVADEGFDVDWPVSAGEDRYRRGLYTFTRRQAPYAQHVTFDGADPSRSCSRRQRSNTPLQALTLLNDPVFVEAAQALAGRALQSTNGRFDRCIEQIYLLCLGRGPHALEVKRLREYWEQQVGLFASDEVGARGMLPAPNDPDRAVREAAAWTSLCSVVLNSHEFITRE